MLKVKVCAPCYSPLLTGVPGFRCSLRFQPEWSRSKRILMAHQSPRNRNNTQEEEEEERGEIHARTRDVISARGGGVKPVMTTYRGL